MLAVKRSVGVTPEMDFGECRSISPLQKQIRQNCTLALKPREDFTRNSKSHLEGY